VTFTQILSKVATIYPVQLPLMFTSFWGSFNFLSFDLSVVPLNCVLDSNFHDRLVFTTVAPLATTFGIFLTWLSLRQRLLLAGGDNLRASISALTSKAIRLAVMVLFTVFPMVSTTVFQTFQYDRRLKDGSAYLVADYSILQNDPSHNNYVVYASAMSILYCFGIPAVSWFALYTKRDQIQKLQMISESLAKLEKGDLLEHQRDAEQGSSHQRRKTVLFKHLVAEATDQLLEPSNCANMKLSLLRFEAKLKAGDPWLVGLSPLYRDYESEYWWLEIPKFISTLILCALITMVPADGASQVFVSLMVSIGMMVLLGNTRPYSDSSDDLLAQMCQTSLTFSMLVGLLELASLEFQDALFGPLLVICTTLNLFVGVVVIMIDFIVTVFPKKTEATMEKVGLMLKFSHARQVSKPTTVAPIGPLSGVPSTEIMQVSARQPTTTSSVREISKSGSSKVRKLSLVDRSFDSKRKTSLASPAIF